VTMTTPENRSAPAASSMFFASVSRFNRTSDHGTALPATKSASGSHSPTAWLYVARVGSPMRL
jgi:hypothetical protein